MPIKKKFSKKPFKKSAPKKKSQLVALIKKTIHKTSEPKYVERIAQVQVFDGASGSVGLLMNGIQQGDTSSTRTGMQIHNMLIQIRGDVSLLTALAHAQQFLGVALVWDKNPNKQATVPSWGDVFQYVNTTSDTKAFVNQSNKNRFIVLRKKYIEISASVGPGFTVSSQQTAVSQKPDSFRISWNVRLNKPTLFSTTGNAGTIADINRGALFMICSAMVFDTAAANTHNLTYSSRLTFSDV